MAEQKKSNLWLIIGAIVVVLAVVYWFMSSRTGPETTTPAETGAAVSTEPAPAAPATDGAVSVEPATPAPDAAAPTEPAPVEPAPTEPAPAGTAPSSN